MTTVCLAGIQKRMIEASLRDAQDVTRTSWAADSAAAIGV